MSEHTEVRHGLDPRIFVAIVEESPTSVMITDPQGSIEYVNRKFSQFTMTVSVRVFLAAGEVH